MVQDPNKTKKVSKEESDGNQKSRVRQVITYAFVCMESWNLIE